MASAIFTCLIFVVACLAATAEISLDPEVLMEIGTQRDLENTMANMTLPIALRALPPMPPELSALIATKLGTRSNHGRTRHKTFLQMGLDASRLSAHVSSAVQAATLSVDKARAMLNDMFADAVKRLDLLKLRCKELFQQNRKSQEETKENIAQFSSQAAGARAQVLSAETIIATCKVQTPKLETALDEHNKKCDGEIISLKHQIEVLSNDSTVLDRIVQMTKCKDGAFIQCGNRVTFKGRILRRKVARLKSRVAREALGTALLEVANRGPNTNDKASVVVPVNGQKTNKKCSVSDSPNCDKLRGKFVRMLGETSDEIDEQKSNLAKLESACKKTRETYESQLAELDARNKEQQVVLAEGTRNLVEANEQIRLGNLEMKRLMKELQRTFLECKQGLLDLSSEMCGIKQIRVELYKMSGMKKYIVDCQVSPWTPDDCSVSCGGGIQNLTRKIVVPANFGAPCPPLVVEKKCNEQHCPVDCSIGQWSGWSSCSAKCGGGVKERSRKIQRQAKYGGEPCGLTQDSITCGEAACAKPCVLAPWTQWSSCSKACDRGSKKRYRHVLKKAVAGGACPRSRSRLRYHLRFCNKQKCKPPPTFKRATPGVLQCQDKLDVVLILDGSGSVRSSGWAVTKKIGQIIVKAFTGGDDKAKVAAMVFSGPRSWPQVRKCRKAKSEADIKKECNIYWVDHMGTDMNALAGKIGSSTWPRASTFTSVALAQAAAELSQGRRDAKSIVITVTDGRAFSTRMTSQVAKQMRKTARLMWIGVGRTMSSPYTVNVLKKWSSTPYSENILLVKDFRRLEQVSTINKIISDACPNVK